MSFLLTWAIPWTVSRSWLATANSHHHLNYWPMMKHDSGCLATMFSLPHPSLLNRKKQKIIILHFQNRFFVIGLYNLKLSLQLSVMTSNDQPHEKGVSIQCFRDYFLWLKHQELNTMTSLQILHYKITNARNKIHRS